MVDTHLIGQIGQGHDLSRPRQWLLTDTLRITNVGKQYVIEGVLNGLLLELMSDPISGDYDTSALQVECELRK